MKYFFKNVPFIVVADVQGRVPLRGDWGSRVRDASL